MAEITVRTLPQFERAKGTFQAGDTIVFSKRRWARLALDPGWSDVRFASKPGATFAGFELAGSINLTLAGLDISLCDEVGIQLRRDGPQLTTVKLLGCHLHDNTEHSLAGAGHVTVEDCVFDKVDRLDCELEGGKKCPEHVRAMGGNWTFTSNTFGDAAENGPLVRIFPQSEYPLIEAFTFTNNILYSTRRNQSGLDIEGSMRGRFPTNIRVVNNTFWTPENGVGLGSSWAEGSYVEMEDGSILRTDDCPAEERPLVANNIFRFEGVDQCNRGRFFNNLSQGMRGECAGVTLGAADLDEEFRPTATSIHVIGKADPEYAPATDFFGQPRLAAPSLGAIEYEGPGE